MELVFLLFSLCIFPYWSLMEPLSLWSLLLQNCSKLAESDHCSGFLVNALAWSTTNWKITILLKVHRSESWSEQRYCRSKGSIGQDPRTKKWSDRPLTERSDLDLRADRITADQRALPIGQDPIRKLDLQRWSSRMTAIKSHDQRSRAFQFMFI